MVNNLPPEQERRIKNLAVTSLILGFVSLLPLILARIKWMQTHSVYIVITAQFIAIGAFALSLYVLSRTRGKAMLGIDGIALLGLFTGLPLVLLSIFELIALLGLKIGDPC